MTKNSNFEDLTEEELAELLDNDEDDMIADETHDTIDNIDVELYTNKKKVKLTVPIKQIETWDDFEVCLD